MRMYYLSNKYKYLYKVTRKMYTNPYLREISDSKSSTKVSYLDKVYSTSLSDIKICINKNITLVPNMLYFVYNKDLWNLTKYKVYVTIINPYYNRVSLNISYDNNKLDEYLSSYIDNVSETNSIKEKFNINEWGESVRNILFTKQFSSIKDFKDMIEKSYNERVFLKTL